MKHEKTHPNDQTTTKVDTYGPKLELYYKFESVTEMRNMDFLVKDSWIVRRFGAGEAMVAYLRLDLKERGSPSG